MEAKLTEFVDRLKGAAGANLKAIVLYGSAAAGEFQTGHSDLNTLCLVDRAGTADIEKLHQVVRAWVSGGNPAPFVFTLDELKRSADVFAVELLDMKRQHRMLYGEDFLETLEVPLQLHRLQVERELRQGWLRLRQAILIAPQKKAAHLAMMRESVSAFCTLFRHALLALGQGMTGTAREAVDTIASLTGGNASGFHTILDWRAGKRKEKQIDVEATLQIYLEFVEIVTNEVDRRLDTP
jgi:hypothetical protein